MKVRVKRIFEAHLTSIKQKYVHLILYSLDTMGCNTAFYKCKAYIAFRYRSVYNKKLLFFTISHMTVHFVLSHILRAERLQ